MKEKKERKIKISGLISLLSLVIILSTLTVSASLQVTSFSCAGQTGVVDVANGDQFSCEATINNPDTTTRSLSTVNLFVDGNWLDSTNYLGSGLDNSLSAGESTTVVFSGLIPKTAGLHKFSQISLDDVSDAFVADTIINVIDITASSVVQSSASSASGSTVTIYATITSGGNTDISANLTVSGTGCRISSDDSALKKLGTVDDNGETSVSWAVIIGTASCSYSIKLIATTKSSPQVTDTKTGTISCSNCASSPGGGSSSGGGGGGGDSSTATQLADIIAREGQTGLAKFSEEALKVTLISVYASKGIAGEFRVKEGKKPALSAIDEQEGKVYKYLEVELKNFTNNNIKNATIRFKVNKDWLANNSFKTTDILMKKYHSSLASYSWSELTTKIVLEDSAYYYYEAETDSFSTFAIVGKKSSAAPITGGVVEENKTQGKTPETEIQEQKEGKERIMFNKNLLFFGVAALVIIVVIIISVSRRKAKTRHYGFL